MRKGGGYWKLHLVVLLQLLFALHGVEMQQQAPKPQQVKPPMKPQIYWATSVDSSNDNRRFQQNDWISVPNNHIDRDWAYTYPPMPPAPAPVPPPTTSAPAPPAPAPPSYWPPPPSYTAPPTYPDPAPPAPAPPAPAPPAPPAYPDPSPPAYPADPAPQPSYDARVPSYGAPSNPPGYYYYYYPVKQVSKGPSIKDMIDKDKEAIAAMMPGKLNHLTYEQKIWLSVLTPLMIVAFIIPLAAILLSGFQITTTNGRSFGELNISNVEKIVKDFAASYGAVLESEECMQRIICDLGSYAKDVPGKTYMLMFLSTLVPETMKNNMAIFQKAATYGADKAQCKSFKCSAWKY